MPREPFNTLWAQEPAQFEQPSDSLISTGWQGGITADAPRAQWQNWYQNRVDYALQDIERMGAMTWHEDAQYSTGTVVSADGGIYSAAADGISIDPSVSDETSWYPITFGPATDGRYGLLKNATQQQVDSGTGDSSAVTPKKLRLGFQISLSTNGYIFFPTWMGGLVIQWGADSFASTNAGKGGVTLPKPMPNRVLFANLTDDANDPGIAYLLSWNAQDTTKEMIAYVRNPIGFAPSLGRFCFFAIGY